MNGRRFAAWVEPIALEFEAVRAEVAAFARSAQAGFWDGPSALEGWTNKDVLSHLAGGTGKQHQALLRAVIANTKVDPELFGNSEVVNNRDIVERQPRTIEEMLNEYDADSEELLDLMAQLKDGDGDRRQKGFDQSFGEALPIFWRHEREHLDQLRSTAGVPA